MRFPLVGDGMRVGLLGGSFNPAHEGHRQISLLALKRLQLDAVWWLVSPGNPHKDNRLLPSVAQRMAVAQNVSAHPRVFVSDVESQLGTVFSVDTVAGLGRRFARVRFVWLMGADQFANFHRWKDWAVLSQRVPIAVIDRPGSSRAALSHPAAHALSRWRLREESAALLAHCPPPAWVFLHGLKNPASSTSLRKNPSFSYS